MDPMTASIVPADFPAALESGMIRAFFQPVFRSMTQQIIGVESLARWFRPDGTVLSPADFIPALERTGLIFRLDMEILRQACSLYDDFRRRGTPLQCVTVNLSRLDFGREDLFETVCAVLDQYAVPHEAVRLEITESMMLEDTEAFEKSFRRFTDAGFRVWLDDFGSGYSSLNVLQNYSFDVIKFDILFLRKLSARGREMLASLISMAKSLGIHTLTEGVETNEQREFLLTAGCEALQGFYYARPMSAEKLTELIDQNDGLLETAEDLAYWNEIGRLNFVNPNPLKDYSERQASISRMGYYVTSYDGSIALVECGRDRFHYVYATEGYRERLQELGFMSVESLEQALSNQRSYQYLMVRKLVMDALRTGTVQTVEHAFRDVYFRLSALLVARRKDRVMICMRLNTFDSERELETAREMLANSTALLTTYDLVVKIMPAKNAAKRIYAASSLAEYDREPAFELSLQRFCRDHVDPADRERYLRFLDLGTLSGRISKSPLHFVQHVFRMRLGGSGTAWYAARVTQIPSGGDPEFLLTVHNLQGTLSEWIDQLLGEHPELL